MKIVKTDFGMQGIVIAEKGWIINVDNGKYAVSCHLIDNNGNIQLLPYDGVFYNQEGLYENVNGKYLNSSLEIVEDSKLAEKLDFSICHKYRVDSTTNYKGNNLLAEALGVQSGQFGLIIKRIEDKEIRVMAINQSDIFEQEDLSQEDVFSYLSKDGLTIIVFKQYCKNFMILDNPLA